MFKTIKTFTQTTREYARLAIENHAFNKQFVARQAEADAYNAMIAASQAKLAETTLVPGYTKIYA